MLRYFVALLLIIAHSFGALLPLHVNLAELRQRPPATFPTGVVACGSTFCDEEKCRMIISEVDGSKSRKCIE